MPPKPTFSRERVLDAAFAVLAEEGWAAVSARAVAARLGASTQPIYSHLRSMDELAAALRVRAVKALAAYQAGPSTGNELLDMAVGYVRFAQERPRLFAFLYLEAAVPPSAEERALLHAELERLLGRPIPFDALLGGLDTPGRDDLALKGWIFAHGLAVALAHGALAPLPEDRIAALLAEAGEAFYAWGAARRR